MDIFSGLTVYLQICRNLCFVGERNCKIERHEGSWSEDRLVDGQFDSVGEDWFITFGLKFRVLELEIVVVPRMIRKS